MAKQRVVNHGAIQKVRYLHNGILIPFTCVIFRQSYLITSPLLFKLWSGRKNNLCIHGCFSFNNDYFK